MFYKNSLVQSCYNSMIGNDKQLLPQYLRQNLNSPDLKNKVDEWSYKNETSYVFRCTEFVKFSCITTAIRKATSFEICIFQKYFGNTGKSDSTEAFDKHK